MNTKKLKALQEQIDQTEKRRHEILTDLAQATQNVADKRQAAGRELLAGKDTSNGLQLLASESVRVDALQEAISQADDQLRTLRQQYSDIERADIKENFDAVGREAIDLLQNCLDRLHQAVAELDALHSKLIELNRVGAPAGLSYENHDQLRYVEVACRYLRGDINATDAISYRIKHIEENYGNILEEARAQKDR